MHNYAESVSLFSNTNLENSRERMGGHLFAPYPAMGYRREVVAYFISKVFQNLYSKISFQPHAFFFVYIQLNH